MNANNVSALSYQNNVDLSFTFSPYITLDVSGDLLIESLVPGSSSDSNIITVSASSNNIVGYDIKATVGDSTNNYTDLRISPSDSTNIFSSLSTNKATLSAFSDDTWGYSYSTDNGTTWVSGNTGSTNTGYNGLPLYTGTGVKLADTSSAGSSTVKFKIGAKASSSKVSGDYTNIINFILTSKILTTNYTLNYLPNDGNNGQDVSGMPNPATVSNTITDDTNYTLSNSTPTRSGYTFAGWCDGTVTNEACSGTTYQPGTTYTISNTGGSSTINLNAMWNIVLINFTVGSATYQALEGMTWSQFIESEYNDGAFSLKPNCDNVDTVTVGLHTILVPEQFPNDIISTGYVYGTRILGGCNYQ